MCINKSLFVPVLVAVLCSVLSREASAQTYATLHNFTPTVQTVQLGPFTNSDGANPLNGVIISGNLLYGTASGGGNWGSGTMFKIGTDGSGFTNLQSFVQVGPSKGLGGGDGGDLSILFGQTFYGVRGSTLFTIGIDGTGYSLLHDFVDPYNQHVGGPGSVASSSNVLYGFTTVASDLASGTIFRMNADGTGFTNLHSFTGGEDGGEASGLIVADDELYGSAMAGGSAGFGVLFRLNIDGTGLTNLHNFTRGNDGGQPSGALTLRDHTLYGTTISGGGGEGNYGSGTVFKINTDGSGYAVLHRFAPGYTITNSDGMNPLYINTNSDGLYPIGNLAILGNTLYGTTPYGGTSGGTVFRINIDGTGFAVLHGFAAAANTLTNVDGSSPNGIVISGNTLYGTTAGAGTGGNGTIFSISIPPELALATSGPNLVLTWPTNFAGFTLQQSIDLGSAWTTYTLQAPPVVSNGQFVVTIPNTATNTQQFFRLSQ